MSNVFGLLMAFRRQLLSVIIKSLTFYEFMYLHQTQTQETSELELVKCVNYLTTIQLSNPHHFFYVNGAKQISLVSNGMSNVFCLVFAFRRQLLSVIIKSLTFYEFMYLYQTQTHETSELELVKCVNYLTTIQLSNPHQFFLCRRSKTDFTCIKWNV